jgi:uncharacterized protein involved in exopolysaccharide biosynthesis
MSLPSADLSPRVPGEVSILELANFLLRSRRRIALMIGLSILVAVTPTVFERRTYTVFTTFVPQVVDPTRSTFANLVGQFGVALPVGAQVGQTPQFYADLVKSKEVLGALADDTLAAPPFDTARTPVTRAFDATGQTPGIQRENAIRTLKAIVTASVVKATGVINITVTTRWPAVSLELSNRLLDHINGVSLRTRQSQAASERQFSADRLRLARDSLSNAEFRLESFLRANRQLRNAPDLEIQQARLQRELTIQLNIFTSLTQAFEEARMREARDTPAITIIDRPVLPAAPNSFGRIRRAAVGALVGLLLGIMLALAAEILERRRLTGDPQALMFLSLIDTTKADLMAWRRRKGPRLDGA